MRKIYFTYKGLANFAHDFHKQFLSYHDIKLKNWHGKLSEEAMNMRLEQKKFLLRNGKKMSALVWEETRENIEFQDWIECSEKNTLNDANRCVLDFLKIIHNTRMAVEGKMHDAKPFIFFDCLKMLLALPFTLFESIFGYDLRKQEIYKKWMTIIVVAAFAVLLINQFFDLAEKAVRLLERINVKP